MPSFDNTAYIEISEGENFGLIDILGSLAQKDLELDKFIENMNLLSRQFCVMATNNDTEVMSFSI